MMIKTISKSLAYTNLRSFSALAGTNFLTFNDLDTAVDTINQKRPLFHVLLLTEDWHPQTDAALQDLQRLSEEYTSTFEVFHIDATNDRRLPKYFNSRHSPEFVICAYGQDIRRAVGIDYDRLKQQVDRTLEWQNSNDNDLPLKERTYWPFDRSWEGIRFDVYSQDNEHNRI